MISAVRWRQLAGEGLQQVRIEAHGDGLAVDGVVVGEADGRPSAGTFRIVLDADWTVRQFAVHHIDGHRFHGHMVETGRWTDHDGKPLAAFDGALDIDISATPFTNTLPIRRLTWQAGQSRNLDMLYVPFDTLKPRRDRQRYTCFEPGRRFHYEGLLDGFTAEITVDDDGLVVDYPGLFTRIG